MFLPPDTLSPRLPGAPHREAPGPLHGSEYPLKNRLMWGSSENDPEFQDKQGVPLSLVSCGTVQPTPQEAGPAPHPQRSFWSPEERSHSLGACRSLSHLRVQEFPKHPRPEFVSRGETAVRPVPLLVTVTHSHSVVALGTVLLLGKERVAAGGYPMGAKPRLRSPCSEPLPRKLSSEPLRPGRWGR